MIAKRAGSFSDGGCCRKKSLLQHFPSLEPRSPGNEGEREFEFWGWVRMTQEVWRVCVGWEERVIRGGKLLRSGWSLWVAGLRGTGALFAEFWGSGLRENEVKPVNFYQRLSSKIPSASFCRLGFRMLRINTGLFFLEICHYPSKGQNGPYSTELVKVNFWDCVRNAGFLSCG